MNPNDPGVQWLVITNWTLFAVTAICVLVAVYGIAVEVLRTVRRRAAAQGLADDHAMMMPELGLTMADGGERIADKKNKQR